MDNQNELERLRAHNKELLDELKASKAALSESQAAHDVLTTEANHYKAQVAEMKTNDAWLTVIKNAGMDSSMAKFITVAADDIGIGFDDAGAFFTKGGEPVKDGDVVYRPNNEEHCRKVMDPVREVHPFMWPRAQGAGATGDRGYNSRSSSQKPTGTEPSSFGIK